MGIPRIVEIIRKVAPVVLGVDMVHNFYYVGCMIQEKLQRYQEKADRELAVSVGSALCQVSNVCKTGEFWPSEITHLLDSVVLPSLDLPPPSYENHGPPVSIVHRMSSCLQMLGSRLVSNTAEDGNLHPEDNELEETEVSFAPPESFESDIILDGVEELQNDGLESAREDPSCCRKDRWMVYCAV